MIITLTKSLLDQLNEIESLIPKYDQLASKVSKATVGWHLDHMLKAINAVYSSISKSDPANFKTSFNLKRALIFAIGWIPRGRAKSPKAALPPMDITKEDIHSQLENARKNIKEIDTLNKNQYFRHFIFGVLDRDKTKRFIEIHTNHHLKITRDIVRQQ